jgi:outer membrane protein OmpA-like peptidoglycan-associated protein/tetratricopeptide (TPR) repeat protein
MKKILLVTVISVLFFQFGQAQKTSHLIKKLEHDAKEFYKADEFLQALPFYLKLDSISPNNGFYNFRIGVCYFNTFAKSKCLPYFLKAKELKYQDSDLDLYIAHAYHLNHRFDEAIQHFRYYKDSLAMKPKEKHHHSKLKKDKQDADRYIEMCVVGKELYNDSLDFVIENMGPVVNSQYPDYVPIVSADEHVLIFTSRRPNTTGGQVDPYDEHYYEDIYICEKTADGKWSEPADLKNVNTEYHDACIGLSPDGHKLFIYRAEEGLGDIYISKLKGKEWSKPELMGKEINSESWEPSATISADEKTIFFSSDRPGGFGGTDIWCMKMKPDGSWGTPFNMGEKINSKYDEDAPYIHPDNKTLFFSSKGHRSMGGFDIFTSTYDMEKNEWGPATNAGYPINTADDDIYFIWSADGTKGYFSSWRPDSYGEKDLYVIHRPGGTSNVLVLKGNIYDKETKQPLEANITLTDNDKNEQVATYHSNSATGRYAVVLPHGVHYGIAVEANGYLFYSENFDYPSQNPFFEMRKDVYLERVKPGASIVLKNIFFDFDKATLRDESKAELENLYQFMMENPEIRIEISGHTDNKGKDKYNQKLSERRAESVVEYLVAKGIDKKRLVAKGYGASKPIATNDTDEGRQENRRTELKIIK